MNMNNTLRPILTMVSIALVFMLFFIVPALLIPVSENLLKKINPEEMQSFFPLLILYSLYMSLPIICSLAILNRNEPPCFCSCYLHTL
jgi:Kef-type K+ transport system membrane component KefB